MEHLAADIGSILARQEHGARRDLVGLAAPLRQGSGDMLGMAGQMAHLYGASVGTFSICRNLLEAAPLLSNESRASQGSPSELVIGSVEGRRGCEPVTPTRSVVRRRRTLGREGAL